MTKHKTECVVVTLSLLGTKDIERFRRVRKEHFNSDNVCVTCMDTGRDAIPWSELFTAGREYDG